MSSTVLSPHHTPLPALPDPAGSSRPCRVVYQRELNRPATTSSTRSGTGKNKSSTSPVPTAASSSSATKSTRSSGRISRSASRKEESPDKKSVTSGSTAGSVKDVYVPPRSSGTSIPASQSGDGTTSNANTRRTRAREKEEKAGEGVDLSQGSTALTNGNHEDEEGESELELDDGSILSGPGTEDGADEGEDMAEDQGDGLPSRSQKTRDSASESLTPEREEEEEEQSAPRPVSIKLVMGKKRKVDDESEDVQNVHDQEGDTVVNSQDVPASGPAGTDAADNREDVDEGMDEGDHKPEDGKTSVGGTPKRAPRKKRKWLKRGEVDPDDPVAVAKQKERHRIIEETLIHLDKQVEMINNGTHTQLVWMLKELDRRRDLQLSRSQARYEAEMLDASNMRAHATKQAHRDWVASSAALAQSMTAANYRDLSQLNSERVNFKRTIFPNTYPLLRDGKGGGGWKTYTDNLLSQNKEKLVPVRVPLPVYDTKRLEVDSSGKESEAASTEIRYRRACRINMAGLDKAEGEDDLRKMKVNMVVKKEKEREKRQASPTKGQPIQIAGHTSTALGGPSNSAAPASGHHHHHRHHHHHHHHATPHARHQPAAKLPAPEPTPAHTLSSRPPVATPAPDHALPPRSQASAIPAAATTSLMGPPFPIRSNANPPRIFNNARDFYGTAPDANASRNSAAPPSFPNLRTLSTPWRFGATGPAFPSSAPSTASLAGANHKATTSDSASASALASASKPTSGLSAGVNPSPAPASSSAAPVTTQLPKRFTNWWNEMEERQPALPQVANAKGKESDLAVGASTAKSPISGQHQQQSSTNPPGRPQSVSRPASGNSLTIINANGNANPLTGTSVGANPASTAGTPAATTGTTASQALGGLPVTGGAAHIGASKGPNIDGTASGRLGTQAQAQAQAQSSSQPSGSLSRVPWATSPSQAQTEPQPAKDTHSNSVVREWVRQQQEATAKRQKESEEFEARWKQEREAKLAKQEQEREAQRLAKQREVGPQRETSAAEKEKEAQEKDKEQEKAKQIAPPGRSDPSTRNYALSKSNPYPWMGPDHNPEIHPTWIPPKAERDAWARYLERQALGLPTTLPGPYYNSAKGGNGTASPASRAGTTATAASGSGNGRNQTHGPPPLGSGNAAGSASGMNGAGGATKDQAADKAKDKSQEGAASTATKVGGGGGEATGSSPLANRAMGPVTSGNPAGTAGTNAIPARAAGGMGSALGLGMGMGLGMRRYEPWL